jgi:hypothetical protein
MGARMCGIRIAVAQWPGRASGRAREGLAGPGKGWPGREGLAGGGNHGPFRLIEIVGTDGELGAGDLGLARKYSDAGAVDAF